MRLAAALANDVRLQIRYGLYGVSILMVLFWGGVLSALSRTPLHDPRLLVPPLIALNLLITTFYFMAALVLFEKSEGVLSALVTSPLRALEYLSSKVISLSLLATAETLLIAVFVFGPAVIDGRTVLAAMLLGVLYSLAGFITVARFQSINTFLVPSVPVVTMMLIPLVAFFGVVPAGAVAWHPAQPMMALMRGGGLGTGAAALMWCAAAMLLARREFERFVVRA